MKIWLCRCEKKIVILYWRDLLCHYSTEQVWSSFAAFCNSYPLWENQLFWKAALFLAAYEIFLWSFVNLQKMVYCQNWMEALTSLSVEILDLVLVPCGHAIGSCVFHFLKISTFIRCLFLDIREAIKVFFSLYQPLNTLIVWKVVECFYLLH